MVHNIISLVFLKSYQWKSFLLRNNYVGKPDFLWEYNPNNNRYTYKYWSILDIHISCMELFTIMVQSSTIRDNQRDCLVIVDRGILIQFSCGFS